MVDENKQIKITYTNWKGETGTRTIIPKEIFFGSNEWHKVEQWIILGYDVEKNADRTFTLKDIKKWH